MKCDDVVSFYGAAKEIGGHSELLQLLAREIGLEILDRDPPDRRRGRYIRRGDLPRLKRRLEEWEARPRLFKGRKSPSSARRDRFR
jgi:hypothetical protein